MQYTCLLLPKSRFCGGSRPEELRHGPIGPLMNRYKYAIAQNSTCGSVCGLICLFNNWSKSVCPPKIKGENRKHTTGLEQFLGPCAKATQSFKEHLWAESNLQAFTEVKGSVPIMTVNHQSSVFGTNAPNKLSLEANSKAPDWLGQPRLSPPEAGWFQMEGIQQQPDGRAPKNNPHSGVLFDFSGKAEARFS